MLIGASSRSVECRSRTFPSDNVAPTDQIPIVRIDPRRRARGGDGALGADPLLDEGEAQGPPHQRARRDDAQVAIVSRSLRQTACLIPATGFYEWQKREDGKQPYRFRRKDLEPFAFAGVWEFARLGGEDILSTAMIVGEANPLVSGVHDRMPVMLLSDPDHLVERDTLGAQRKAAELAREWQLKQLAGRQSV
jgi:putative SOS response-associated peptidase YedK